MAFSNILTSQQAEVSFSLEKDYGFDQSLAEKIAISFGDISEQCPVILDAAGRLKAYAEHCGSQESIARVYYLLHSQNPKYNYGGFKQIGMEAVPDFLLGKISRYMSVFLRGYIPDVENTTKTSEAATPTVISVPNDVTTSNGIALNTVDSTPNDIPPKSENETSRVDELFSDLTPAEAIYMVKKLIRYFMTD